METISKENVEKIAKRLHGTRGNVFVVAKQVTGHEVGEEVFDLLEKQEDQFKCNECNEWKSLDERNSDEHSGMAASVCCECESDNEED